MRFGKKSNIIHLQEPNVKVTPHKSTVPPTEVSAQAGGFRGRWDSFKITLRVPEKLKYLPINITIFLLMTLVLFGTISAQIKHRFVLLDQGSSKLELIDQFDPANDWTKVISGSSRDLQLVGNNRILVGVSGGYDEVDLKTGTIVKEVTGIGSGIQSVQRLPNGNTMLCSEGLQGLSGTAFVEIDSTKKIIQKFSFPGYGGLRIMRRSPSGTFFFGAGNQIVEGDTAGKVVWKANTANAPGIYQGPNNYQATRLSNGNVLVATGHGANLTILDTAGKVVKTYGGTNQPQVAEVKPNFYAMFQVLKNGHIVVSNWHPTDPGNCVQVLEYDTSGQMVWSFKDPTRITAIHGVLVIDSLDTQLSYNDSHGGVLMPMNQVSLAGPQARRTNALTVCHSAFGMNKLYSLRGKLLGVSNERGGAFTGFGPGMYISMSANGISGKIFSIDR